MQKLFAIMALILAGECQAKDVCAFYKNHPGWFMVHENLSKNSSVSMGEALAIIEIESGFDPYANEGGVLWRWFNPPKSSAKGYAQVLDGAWGDFLKEKGHMFSNRYSFMDSISFIHWYIDKYKNKFKESSPYEHYLLYYNGPGNYAKGKVENQKKAGWVDKIAYDNDQALKACAGELRWQYKWSKRKF